MPYKQEVAGSSPALLTIVQFFPTVQFIACNLRGRRPAADQRAACFGQIRIRLLRLRAKRRCTDNQKFVVLSVCLEFHFVFINLELDRGIGWYDRLILRLWLPNLIFSRRCMYDVLLANYIRRGFLSFVLRTAVDGLLRDDCASHGSRAGQRREAVKDGSGERPSLAFHCLLPLELSSQAAGAKCHLPTILLQAHSFYSFGPLRQGPNAPIRVTVMLPRRNVARRSAKVTENIIHSASLEFTNIVPMIGRLMSDVSEV